MKITGRTYHENIILKNLFNANKELKYLSKQSKIEIDDNSGKKYISDINRIVKEINENTLLLMKKIL